MKVIKNIAKITGVFLFFGFCHYAQASDPVDVYRFWSEEYRAHFYTASKSEKEEVIEKYPDNIWRYEGVAYKAYNKKTNGLTPVYRFWSEEYRAHFYTASKSEKEEVIEKYPDNIWRYEGVAWYTDPENKEALNPVYRFWSEEYRAHFYTNNPNEKRCVIETYDKKTWRYEGVSYYAPGNVPKEDPNLVCDNGNGPTMLVGLWEYSRSDLEETPFKIEANNDYQIKNSAGDIVAQISADTTTRVTYASDGKLKVIEPIKETLVGSEVTFEAKEGNKNLNMIFDVYRPGSPYDQYRGNIKLNYVEYIQDENLKKRIWVINMVPLEQYVWGMGEITGTGPMDYNRVMTTLFRTYGYWKIQYSTQHLAKGFIVDATPGNQLYYGYDYEKKYTRIREAAKNTRGKIVKYGGGVALTPYSSWTDGRTRSFEERWGSDNYPYCQSVKDPYGEHPDLSTQELFDSGNHMVGLSAHGALELAGDDYDWDWRRIVNYYYEGVDIKEEY
jgi:peptidoglycan hydrolase-like amidase